MSLATTCPQCRTSFKVVPDQLKLRRGQVRCGVCRHVFSGLDTLRYVQAEDASDAVASIAIRPGPSASLDAQTQPDPFIDIESIERLGEPDAGDHEVGLTPASQGRADTASSPDATGAGIEQQAVHAPEPEREAVPASKTIPAPETVPVPEAVHAPDTVPAPETVFMPEPVAASTRRMPGALRWLVST